jgi:hypothetical protein
MTCTRYYRMQPVAVTIIPHVTGMRFSHFLFIHPAKEPAILLGL